jgi:hypothetical protein
MSQKQIKLTGKARDEVAKHLQDQKVALEHLEIYLERVRKYRIRIEELLQDD